MTEQFNGTLEVDRERGVMYFHLTDEKDIERLNVHTLLRICRLPVTHKPVSEQMDVTHMVGASGF